MFVLWIMIRKKERHNHNQLFRLHLNPTKHEYLFHFYPGTAHVSLASGFKRDCALLPPHSCPAVKSKTRLHPSKLAIHSWPLATLYISPGFLSQGKHHWPLRYVQDGEWESSQRGAGWRDGCSGPTQHRQEGGNHRAAGTNNSFCYVTLKVERMNLEETDEWNWKTFGSIEKCLLFVKVQ